MVGFAHSTEYHCCCSLSKVQVYDEVKLEVYADVKQLLMFE